VRWSGLAVHRRIGIDLGSRYVKAAELACGSSVLRVEAAAIFPRRNPGGPIDSDEIDRVVQVLSRQGFRASSVVMAVPPQKLMTGMLEVPSGLSGAPLRQLARMEFARMHACDPQSFEMAFWRLPDPARKTDQVQVLAGGCTHEDAEALLGVCQEAGIEVEVLDLPTCAIQRACRPLFSSASGITGLVDLGWSACRVAVCCRGVVVYERSLPEASLASLHEKLRNEFQLDFVKAEILLGEVGLSGGDRAEMALFDRVRTIITDHFDQAVEDLRAPFVYAIRQYGGETSSRLILLGGGASIAGLARHLGERLAMPVRVVSPADLAECPRPLLGTCGRPSLTMAVGLAQFGREDGE